MVGIFGPSQTAFVKQFFSSVLFQHYSVANANCTKDSDCTQGEIDFDGHGGVYNAYIHTYSRVQKAENTSLKSP